MTNKENKAAYIETINKHLNRLGEKQLRIILLVIYEFLKHCPEEAAV